MKSIHRSSARNISETGSRNSCAKFALKALSAAIAFAFVQTAAAVPINAGGNVSQLPTGGNPVSGTVTGVVSGNQLDVTVGTTSAIVDWQSFNIGSGYTVNFTQTNPSSALLNRVTGDANPSQILGSMNGNGMKIMLMNPNGIMFGAGASVNVGALVATTGTIDESQFLSTGNIAISGAGGSISNAGQIVASGTASSAGLVALVAPSVTNSGVITATGGTIALAGATATTISMNGSLYEFAITGATDANISNAAGATLDGATLYLTTGDAANLLSGTINLEGIQMATSAIIVDGDKVVLKSDLNAPGVSGHSSNIDVYNGAQIQDAINIAKSVTVGTGALINVAAGTYTEQVRLNKANLSLIGQTGATIQVPNMAEINALTIEANNVTVSGFEIAGPVNSSYLTYAWGSNISRGIVVRSGYTGFNISNNNIHDVRNGILIDGRNNTGSVSGNRIENTKSGISVQYTDAAGIAISGNSEGPIGNEWGLNLHLNGFLDGGTLYSNPHLTAPTTAQQQALLDLSNTNSGWRVQDQGYSSSNRTHVEVATSGSASAQGSLLTPLNSIQSGVNAVVAGGKVNVAAGTYAESVSIGKALTLNGAGKGLAIIDPLSGNAVNISGNIGASESLVIDGFTFRDAPGYGVNVAGSTTLGQLTIQNSEFLHNGRNGFIVSGSKTTGAPGLDKVSLLNDDFVGNGAVNPTSLGYGDILFNYYNGDITLQNLHITGSGEYIGIQMRGASPTTNNPLDAGTVVFDNVTIDGEFLRPSGIYGTWNPGGPGDAIHLLEYQSVANMSFNDVVINPTVGHGMFVEGLGSTLNIGNTTFGLPDTLITGGGVSPTISRNIFVGYNDNNLVTNVDASSAIFTSAADNFAIEDRVLHALDVSGLGLITWNPGNVYVTQVSGSIQRGIDAASAGNTVNVQAGVYAENVIVNALRNLSFNNSTIHSLTINAAGSGIGGSVIADTVAGFEFNAPVLLLSDTVLDTSAVGGSVTLGNIDGSGAGGQAFSINAGSGEVILGNLGALTRLGGIDVSGNAIRLNGSNYTANSLEFNGPIVLLNDTVFDTSAAGGNILLGSIDGTTAGGQAFTVRAGTGAVELGDLGVTTRLGATAVSGDAIRLNGTNYTANSLEFNAPIVLLNDTVFDTSAAGGNVLLGSIDGISAGGQDFTVRAGTGAVELGDLGAVTRLGTTAVTGDAIRFNGSIYTANSLEFNGRIALTQPRTTFTTNGGNILLNGDIQNVDANPHDLYLMAGSPLAYGNVTLVSGGSASGPLGEFIVESNNFTLDSTLWVGRYRIDASGNVVLSNHTLIGLDANAVNSINAGGATTGTTISASPIHIDAESVDVHVEAPVIQITSVGSATVTGSAETLVINAPSGSVNGNFDIVENLGTSVIEINGRPQAPSLLSSNFDSSHILPGNIGGGTAAITEGGGLDSEQTVKDEDDAKDSQKRRVKTVRGAPYRAGELLASGLSVEIDLAPGNPVK